HVTKGVATDFAARLLDFLDDFGHACAFGQEDVDVAYGVHDHLETLGLGVQIDGRFRHVERVNIPAFPRQADAGYPFLAVEPLAVLHSCCSGKPTARTTHDLVHNQHARARTVLADDV